MSNEIGKRIKDLRVKRGWRQDDVAEMLHVSRQAVSNWENGKTIVSVDYLNEYAKTFEVSLDELVYGEKAVRDEYKPMQKRYIITAAAACFALLACFVLHFTLRPWCVEQYNFFRTTPLLAYMLGIRFFAGGAIPVLLLSALSAFADLRLTNPKTRLRIATVGAIPLFIMFLFFMAYFAHMIPVPTNENIIYGMYRYISRNYMMFTIVSAVVFSVSLFLGVNGIDYKHKNTNVKGAKQQ